MVGTVAHHVRARTTQDLFKSYTKNSYKKGTIPASEVNLAVRIVPWVHQLPQALIAPHEYAALFHGTAGELSYTPDSLRYLGVLALGAVPSATADW